MDEILTGRVYDIQGFSVQDGPGIRTTVFLKGCPLRCPWCHSPESQEFYPQLSWIAMRCEGIEVCNSRCIKACPKGAITPGKISTKASESGEKQVQLVHVDRQLCDNCGECDKVCFLDALYICGIDYTVDDLVKRVCKDKNFYNSSGGGVTISGGEPLCQVDFVAQVFERLKAEEIHTALDTTGFVPWSSFEKVLPYTDLYLYDLKHMDSHDHKVVTGVPNELILENAVKLAAAGGKLQVRIPLIPSFNDSDENIKATCEFVRGLGDAVTVVQLLPYHTLGVMKYQRLDEDKKVMEATPHTEEEVEHVRALIASYDLPVTVH